MKSETLPNIAKTMLPGSSLRRGRSVRRGRPDPVDVHVGSRIRFRRITAGISQKKLAHAIGVTFQQLQKYERATNRVSASVLYRVGHALNTPISFFFDGLDSVGALSGYVEELDSRDSLEFLRRYRALPTIVRQSVAALIKGVVEAPSHGSWANEVTSSHQVKKK